MGRYYKNGIIQQSRDIKNILKNMDFCHLQENLTKLMDTVTKTGIDAAKTASKKVVKKTAEVAGIWLKLK